MKIIKFIFFLILTLCIFIFFNNSYKGIPPLGKFLSPHHGYLQNAEAKEIDLPEAIQLKGLKDEVSIIFDSELIPHITAGSMEDLYFAQGYVTAFHRLWQMEMQLYKTAGRISEILGPDYVDFDRKQRRIGLTYGARRAEEALKNEPELYNKVQAYADGVNAYINTLKPSQYPIEYKLLDYAPEPWSVYKVCLLTKEMADQLSRGEKDMENTNALKLWGAEIFNLLYPERFDAIDPIIPKGTKFDFEPIPVEKPGVTFPLDFTKPAIAAPDPRNGSNNFMVHASKTADGSTLLANEPDLGLNLPSIWYLAHLKAPGINAMGATLPGAPGIIIGFNDSIAWGNTNAKRDLVDWYFIKFKNDQREEYQYDDKWLKTQKIVERINIKNSKSVFDTLVFTHYGPVTYDNNFPASDEKQINLAMRWTAHDPSREVKTIFEVNKANNYKEFVSSFSYYTGPPQNYGFISASGDISMWIHGKFPVKWTEQGKFLLDGRLSSHEWKTFMPQEHNYHVLNPPQNFVSSANQHPGDGTYPYYDYDYNWEYYRGRRINDRLRILNKITVNDMMKLQNDNFNYMAFESLPLMIRYLDSTNLDRRKQDALDFLVQWDYFNEPNRKAPTYFEAWWNNLYKLIWDEFDNQKVALYKPSFYNTYYLMANYPDFDFFDKASTSETETLTDLINEAFALSIDQIEEWKTENGDDISWYLYKNTTISHLLKIKPFSFEQVRIGGNSGIVNAASSTHGPSWRMVVQFKDKLPYAYGVYPGSQSGNPGNPSYGHMIEKWSQGEYYELKFNDIPEQNIKAITTLKPE